MKKRLKQQELNKIKKLLQSKDTDNWELAKQLLKGAVGLNPSFVSYVFCRAYLSFDKVQRIFFQKLLQSSNKDLVALTKSGFVYKKYSSGESELMVDRAAFYEALQKILVHPSILPKTIFAYFNQDRHAVIKNMSPPRLIILLKIEYKLYKNVKSIQTLDIPYVHNFPKGLETLPNLKEIRSSDAQFTSFSPEFQFLKKLERIYFHNLPLEEANLSPYILMLSNLRYISFPYCNLKGSPQFWETLTNNTRIKTLDLCSNKITSVPDLISKLGRLKYIDLSKNPKLAFSKISLELFKLPKLQTVRLNSYNKQQKEILAQIEAINPKLEVIFYKPFVSESRPPAYLRDDG